MLETEGFAGLAALIDEVTRLPRNLATNCRKANTCFVIAA
jgi:hypothetical protein